MTLDDLLKTVLIGTESEAYKAMYVRKHGTSYGLRFDTAYV